MPDVVKFLCPWHDEKTPSCIVNFDKGFYHCFGCGEAGRLEDIDPFGMQALMGAVEREVDEAVRHVHAVSALVEKRAALRAQEDP